MPMDIVLEELLNEINDLLRSSSSYDKLENEYIFQLPSYMNVKFAKESFDLA
jgi:hypothetical protein